jgi:hypothetical protein
MPEGVPERSLRPAELEGEEPEADDDQRDAGTGQHEERDSAEQRHEPSEHDERADGE